MSKRCKLQKEYYKEFGNYKGDGKYSDDYVKWLENEVLALRLYGVVSSKNVLKDYQEAYDYHDKTMKEVKPLSREYFIHYGRREGFRNAIELMTGTEI